MPDNPDRCPEGVTGTYHNWNTNNRCAWCGKPAPPKGRPWSRGRLLIKMGLDSYGDHPGDDESVIYGNDEGWPYPDEEN